MSMDPNTLDRLARSIAQAIEQALVPMQQEVEQLRAEVAALRGAPRMPVAVPARPSASVPPAAEIAARMPRTRAAMPGPSCTVPHCEAAVLAKELCETHYRAMRRAASLGQHFDARTQRPAEARPAVKGCSEAGCDEGHYARGLCRRHYMTVRARERARERGQVVAPRAATPLRAAAVTSAPPVASVPPEMRAPAPTPAPVMAPVPSAAAAALMLDLPPTFGLAFGGAPEPGVLAMPTAEVVARVVSQYRGGLAKVAEVLGRNRRTLMELLERLNLMEHVVSVRAGERQRILAAPLRDRLSDLLFREKLLDDLGCLKEVDESARGEIQLRCAQFAKTCATQEDVFTKLAAECGLEDAGMKRLIWRYDLRRQLRGLKSSRPAPSRARP